MNIQLAQAALAPESSARMRAIYYRSFRSFSVATACEWEDDDGGHLNIHMPTFTHTLYPPEGNPKSAVNLARLTLETRFAKTGIFRGICSFNSI